MQPNLKIMSQNSSKKNFKFYAKLLERTWLLLILIKITFEDFLKLVLDCLKVSSESVFK